MGLARSRALGGGRAAWRGSSSTSYSAEPGRPVPTAASCLLAPLCGPSPRRAPSSPAPRSSGQHLPTSSHQQDPEVQRRPESHSQDPSFPQGSRDALGNVLWRWRGPSGLRWVWRNGRGPHLEGMKLPIPIKTDSYHTLVSSAFQDGPTLVCGVCVSLN